MITNMTHDKSQTTTRDIRKANRLLILHQLLLRKSGTRQELRQLTGLSTATIANLITEMLEEGLVVETGTETPQVGRPTTILALNAEAGVCVGVDVAETYIYFDLYDPTLKNLANYEVELPSSKKEPEEVVQLIVSGLSALLEKAAIERERVVGVGVSIPGPFDHASGVSVFEPSWGWANVPLQAMLEKELGVPIYMDNPLKFNAIAEAWYGAGRAVDSMAAVVLGTGVGAGLVLNGKLYHGASNTAGEWGHSVVVTGGRVCRCGNHGCLEAYVGAPGIIQTLTEIDSKSSLLSVDDETRSITAIAAAAKRGDPVALSVVRQTALYLSAGLGSMINILNPELVILGSWVTSLLGPVLLPTLVEQIKQHSLERPYKAVRFVLSDLSQHSVSLGAATLVLEEYLANPGKKQKRNRSRKGGI